MSLGAYLDSEGIDSSLKAVLEAGVDIPKAEHLKILEAEVT